MNVMKVLPIEEYNKLIEISTELENRRKEKQQCMIKKYLKIKGKKESSVLKKLISFSDLKCSKTNVNINGVSVTKQNAVKIIKLLTQKKFALVNKIKGGKLFLNIYQKT
jgi:hypothetical protein